MAVLRNEAAELKLFSMKAAFDEIMATSVKRQHEPQRIGERRLDLRDSQRESLLFVCCFGSTATWVDHRCLNTRRIFCRPNVADCCAAIPCPKRADQRSIASG
jgi:hypothetical protein